MADDHPDPQASAFMFAHAAADRWITTRFPDLDGYVGRFLAAHLTQLLFPFVKVAAYHAMADTLRDQGLEDVAQAIEQSAAEFLTELRKENDV